MSPQWGAVSPRLVSHGSWKSWRRQFNSDPRRQLLPAFRRVLLTPRAPTGLPLANICRHGRLVRYLPDEVGDDACSLRLSARDLVCAGPKGDVRVRMPEPLGGRARGCRRRWSGMRRMPGYCHGVAEDPTDVVLIDGPPSTPSASPTRRRAGRWAAPDQPARVTTGGAGDDAGAAMLTGLRIGETGSPTTYETPDMSDAQDGRL